MGFFDFFKKKNQFPPKRTDIAQIYSVEPSPIIKRQQAILNDESKSLDERNAAYLAIRDEEVRRLNEAYDFNSIEGVNNIPVPCREVNGGSTTGRVEYYLRGTCFFNHWNAGKTELALACLRKAQELMFVSEMIWKRQDFLRLVEYLYEAGKDTEAEIQLKRIDDFCKQNGVLDDGSYNEARMIENAKTKRRDMQTLQWLQENLPSIAPKSLSGFRRMRTTNSKNYQKLVTEAAKLGKQI